MADGVSKPAGPAVPRVQRPSQFKRLLDAVHRREIQSGTPVARTLESLFDLAGVDTQVLGEIALNALKLARDRMGLLGPAAAWEAWDLPLFHKALRTSIVADYAIEEMLVPWRRAFLARVTAAEHLSDRDLQFVVTLACQCFNNEYVSGASRAEADAVALLAASLSDSDRSDRGGADSAEQLAAYAMYEPLSSLGLSSAILTNRALRSHPHLAELFVRQVDEVSEEQAIKRTIPSFGMSGDTVAAAVRAQYEASPYPRWFTVTVEAPPPFAEVFARVGASSAFLGTEGSLHGLIAGCGTGRHPIEFATRYSDVRLLCIDASKTSLAYAVRQARKYGLANLDLVHGDLLRIEELGRTFDFIDVSGVLHHLSSPADGLRVLTRVLRPGGLMKIGVYSRRARASLRRFQEMASAYGFAGRSDIARLRQDMLGMKHSGTDRLLSGTDFFYTSRVRDLLCHVHEVQFTPAELRPLLESCGLTFLKYTNLDKATRDAYRARNPHDPDIRALESLDQFEAEHPDIFDSLQSFLVRKDSDVRAAIPG